MASQYSHSVKALSRQAARRVLAAGLLIAAAWFGLPQARAQGPAPSAPATCPALLDHRLPRLQDEAPQDLCQYKGRVLLIVNTASYCGFTPQYEGLEKLQAKYGPRGFTVLGFPSNDFFQEPKSGASIAEFCTNTYGVKFPMFAKSAVRGSDANPVFAALAQQSGQAPRWNFHKYLVDRQGKVVAQFGSRTEPGDREITSRIEGLLAGG